MPYELGGNFTDKTGFHVSTPDLHVIQRFTRVDDHALLYRFTIDDPQTWTKALSENNCVNFWAGDGSSNRLKLPMSK